MADYYVHTKTGGKYRSLGHAKIQTEIPLVDYDDVSVYQSLENGMIWVRPSNEFEERFHTVVDRGGWVQVYSGNKFYPNDPRAEDFSIVDIAHCLSMQCRFAGHIEEFYSVAEHSVNVSNLCLPENKLAGLLHDGSETFISDIVSPAKRQLPDYAVMEKRIQETVYTKFGLPVEHNDDVKRADLIMLYTEARQLLKPSPEQWMDDDTPSAEITLKCLAPKQAKELFLDTYHQINKEQNK